MLPWDPRPDASFVHWRAGECNWHDSGGEGAARDKANPRSLDFARDDRAKKWDDEAGYPTFSTKIYFVLVTHDLY